MARVEVNRGDGISGQDKAAQRHTEGPKLLRIFLKISLQYFLMCAVMLVSAGTLLWMRAWVYLAVALVCFLVNACVVHHFNPDLIAERHRHHEDTKPFDKVLTRLIAVDTILMLVVSGLDAVRYKWSFLPDLAVYPGILLHALGMATLGWAMSSNPYVEKTVRIQVDRDQRVISVGPYALIRHPMYLGMILMGIGFPLIAGSAWSVAPLGVYIFLFILRTALEDKTLRSELSGYEEYARDTRHRLVPGLW
ncbi:MAG TPA: isoprenylcysteine carboxylmethyltransferase family protein [Acidobacteriota bacterium]|nr:isoprenylcysteine carboxylmethyltransferase family protein [Acidobacteriota bacterium]